MYESARQPVRGSTWLDCLIGLLNMLLLKLRGEEQCGAIYFTAGAPAPVISCLVYAQDVEL